MLFKAESFIFQNNFVIIDIDVAFDFPIILGRPLLASGHALVDMENGLMKFRLNNE